MSGSGDSELLDCREPQPSALSGVEEDLQLAAAVDVPVLISGPPDASSEIACEIDRRSGAPRRTVEVIDCRQGDAIAVLQSRTLEQMSRGRIRGTKILLLQEVHALSLADQALLVRRLDFARPVRGRRGIRILASSSVPLFERVVDQLFDESLFYRLNVIHIVVPSDFCGEPERNQSETGTDA